MTKKAEDSTLTIIIIIVACLIFSSVIGGLVWFFREDLFGTTDETESSSPGPSKTPTSGTPGQTGTPPSGTPPSGTPGQTGTPGTTPPSGTPSSGMGIPFPSLYTSTSNNLVRLYFDGVNNGRSVNSAMASSDFTYTLAGATLTLTINSLGGSTIKPYTISGDFMQISDNSVTLVKKDLAVPSSGPSIPIPVPSLYTADGTNDDRQLIFSNATNGSAKLFNQTAPFTYNISGNMLQTFGTFADGEYRISIGANSLTVIRSTLFTPDLVFNKGTLPPAPPPPSPQPPTVAFPFPSKYSTGQTATTVTGVSSFETIFSFDTDNGTGSKEFIRRMINGTQTISPSTFTYKINGTTLNITETPSGSTFNSAYTISADLRTLTGSDQGNGRVFTRQP